MAITFGGLATGLDTNSIVKELMAIERFPIDRLNTDKAWFESKQAAYGAFDGKLKSFLSNIENLGSSEDLRKTSVAASTDEFLSVTASSDALPGASYQVEVVSLAQVQKNVSQGYADKTASIAGLSDLTLTVGDNDPVTISLDASNDSLEGVMQAINDADAGVNASIINDGTDTPYRLVLTGENSATSFSLSMTSAVVPPPYNGDLTAALQNDRYPDPDAQFFGEGTIEAENRSTNISGANSLNDIIAAINTVRPNRAHAVLANDVNGYYIEMTDGVLDSVVLSGGTGDTGGGILGFSETQAATEAHIRVDNIDIYSTSNTLNEAIPGLTLDLTSAEEGTTTTFSVSLDEAAIKSQIESFVSGYNDVMSYISSQSATGEAAGGILGGDAGMNSVKRRMQNLLTTTINNTGSLAALSQLGLQTQRDGTLVLDDSVLTDAVQNNLDSVEKLLVGEDDTEGIAVRFQSYLEGITDIADGFYAANKKTTESTISRIDDRIEQIEARLLKKEETMRKKFSAMEELVSGMNNQSSFLTQQLDMVTNMMTGNKQ